MSSVYHKYLNLSDRAKLGLERFSFYGEMPKEHLNLLFDILDSGDKDNYGVVLSSLKYLNKDDTLELISKSYGKFKVILRFLIGVPVDENLLADAINESDINTLAMLNEYASEKRLLEIAANPRIHSELSWLTQRFLLENPRNSLEGVCFKAKLISFESRNDVLNFNQFSNLLDVVISGRFDISWAVVGGDISENEFKIIAKGVYNLLCKDFSTSTYFSARALLRVAELNGYSSSVTNKVNKKLKKASLVKKPYFQYQDTTFSPWRVGYWGNKIDPFDRFTHLNSSIFGLNSVRLVFRDSIDSLIFHRLPEDIYLDFVNDSVFDSEFLSHPDLNLEKLLKCWVNNRHRLSFDILRSELSAFKPADIENTPDVLALIAAFYFFFIQEKKALPDEIFYSYIAFCIEIESWEESVDRVLKIFSTLGFEINQEPLLTVDLDKYYPSYHRSAFKLREDRCKYFNSISSSRSILFNDGITYFDFLNLLDSSNTYEFAFEILTELATVGFTAKSLELVKELAPSWYLSGKDLVKVARFID